MNARRQLAAESSRPDSPDRTQAALTESDWAYCKRALGEVSRTFSRPIAMLRDELEVAVTVGYLLCRVADTIEDDPALDADTRDHLFRVYLDVLERGADPATFAAASRVIEASPAHERELAQRLPRVLAVLATLPDAMQATVLHWVAEMSRGMGIYARRRPGVDGFVSLTGLPDLERYCYFVAGTVGHMLTELFTAALPALDPEAAITLQQHAEAFAVGLQLTNILKDFTDDFERRVSFVPRMTLQAAGVPLPEATDPARRAAVQAVMEPIFDRAQGALDRALEYALALPADARDLRLFCLLPLWLAVRTLAHTRGHADQLVPGRKVKIARAEVEALIADCVQRAGDDDALRRGYAHLKALGKTPFRLPEKPSRARA